MKKKYSKSTPVVDKYQSLKDEITLHLVELSEQGLLTRHGAISDIEDILAEKQLDNLKVNVLSLGNNEFKINVEDL